LMLFETNAAIGSCLGFVPGTPTKMDQIGVMQRVLYLQRKGNDIRKDKKSLCFRMIAVFSCKL